ncbi:hypothetical protein M2375_004113 [Comamonas sp. BIGb0152]|uniref:DUF6882 domain-containing protein n=1 Tax=Comamonas sp. BIGb0152 TaxID=2940601 RepID=UPI00216A746E|nr:DUF6882 domain-containing protein [Comamonas sp. BIGb0152]MCS4295863.1 hypothetical protein [Comamonas sp. BIGb0152]
MGLWQKLFGWLNPSAPTAAPAETQSPPAAAVAVSAPQDPAARGTREPAFDPAAELAAPVSNPSSAFGAPQSPVAAAAADAAPSAQADLFEAAAAREADIPAAIADPALREALSTYAGMAWDRQLDFADKVGDRPWSADTAQGLIAFGDDLRFRMQVLGSYSFQSGTWLWIWAHTQAEVAPAFTEVARQLQGFGAAKNLALFTEPRTALRQEDLHVIGLIAAGADDSAGYYLGNYGEGILLALIDPDHGLPSTAPKPERVPSVVSQLISDFELDHRLLLQHYLPAKGFSVQETGSRITGQHGPNRIVADLDSQGRISAVSGSLGPA